MSLTVLRLLFERWRKILNGTATGTVCRKVGVELECRILEIDGLIGWLLCKRAYRS